MACNSKNMPGYLRRTAAARHLGVSVRTLGELQRRRLLPFYRLTPRCVLFKVEDLDQALARFRIEAAGGLP
jgi:excisionase family DNA binding protein